MRSSAKDSMKKWLHIAVVVLVIATVAMAVLSFSAYGENEDANAAVVTPVDGVYTVENASSIS